MVNLSSVGRRWWNNQRRRGSGWLGLSESPFFLSAIVALRGASLQAREEKMVLGQRYRTGEGLSSIEDNRTSKVISVLYLLAMSQLPQSFPSALEWNKSPRPGRPSSNTTVPFQPSHILFPVLLANLVNTLSNDSKWRTLCRSHAVLQPSTSSLLISSLLSLAKTHQIHSFPCLALNIETLSS